MEWLFWVDFVATLLAVCLALGTITYVVTAIFVSRPTKDSLRHFAHLLFAVYVSIFGIAGLLQDFDSAMFFVLLSVDTTLPLAFMVALLNVTLFTLVFKRVPFRAVWAGSITVLATVTLIVFLSNGGGKGSPLFQIIGTEVFGIIGTMLDVCFLVAVIGAPVLYAIMLAISCIRVRMVLQAAGYIAVPILAVAVFFLGERVSDVVAVHTIGAVIQSAIQEARHGVVLAPASQTQPLRVSSDYQVATYAMAGPLFLAQYIAYDGRDSDESSASRDIAKMLNQNQCSTSARQIGSHYYYVTEAC